MLVQDLIDVFSCATDLSFTLKVNDVYYHSETVKCGNFYGFNTLVFKNDSESIFFDVNYIKKLKIFKVMTVATGEVIIFLDLD